MGAQAGARKNHHRLLAVGSQRRGALRQVCRGCVAASREHLFPPRPAFGRYLLPGWEEANGKAVFRGENPPEGALLTFWIGEPIGEPVEIEIANAQGQPVARFRLPEVTGLTRLSWNLRRTKDLQSEYGGQGEDRLLSPGEYRVQMKHGKAKEKDGAEPVFDETRERMLNGRNSVSLRDFAVPRKAW